MIAQATTVRVFVRQDAKFVRDILYSTFQLFNVRVKLGPRAAKCFRDMDALSSARVRLFDQNEGAENRY